MIGHVLLTWWDLTVVILCEGHQVELQVVPDDGEVTEQQRPKLLEDDGGLQLVPVL